MASASQTPSVVIHMRSGGAGDPSKWPQNGYSAENPAPYLTKLAAKYMHEKGQVAAGKRYTLDRLPEGFALYGKTRENDPNHVDRYLYGHPKYRFRSVEEFYPHFRHLMDNGSDSGCQCIGCNPGSKKRTKVAGPMSARRPRQRPTDHGATGQPQQVESRELAEILKLTLPLTIKAIHDHSAYSMNYRKRPRTPDSDKVDEEGTRDVYRQMTDKLARDAVLDEPIEELHSFDWVIDRMHIQQTLRQISERPAYVPRRGEVVLFQRYLEPNQNIVWRSEEEAYAICGDDGQVLPKSVLMWEAGIVTDLPIGDFSPGDLTGVRHKTHQVNYSGFRIEPIAMIGSSDKSFSKRPAQVFLHQIRPFCMYKEALKGTRPPELHPTVHNVLTSMSSFSLVERYHIKAVWPEATIFCRALYLGSELIVVGDTVRLLPDLTDDQEQVWDALIVTSIKFKMLHLDALENADFDDPQDEMERQYDCCVHVDGVAYTRDQGRAWGLGKSALDTSATPPLLRDYGGWYRLHAPQRRLSVPFSRILGRCFERQALDAWFTSHLNAGLQPNPSASFAAINRGIGEGTSRTDHSVEEVTQLTRGLHGVIEARLCARSRDDRLRVLGKKWFWADSRVEQLDLQEVRSFTTGPYISGKPSRDVSALRRAMSVRARGAGHRSKHVSVAKKQDAKRSLISASAVGANVEVVEDDDIQEIQTDDPMDVDVTVAITDVASAPTRMMVPVIGLSKDVESQSDQSSEVDSEIEHSSEVGFRVH